MLHEEFEAATGRYNRELLAHCYRMLGSLHDAEDVVQETMLRAWRAADRYDPDRASWRTWLYRIATNVCLTALETRGRRPLPSGLVGRSEDPAAALVPSRDVSWLEPFPTNTHDPVEVLERRETLRLAFVAALQLLPARQRAVLILQDVLQWPAADVAVSLGLSVAAVNSALQRARARLRLQSPGLETFVPSTDSIQQAVLARYVEAFQRADLPALTALLSADVVLEMPPVPLWYSGTDHYRLFMARVYALRGISWRAVRTSANNQPALAAYALGQDGRFHAHSLQVLSVENGLIAHNVVFADPSLFANFGLPVSVGN